MRGIVCFCFLGGGSVGGILPVIHHTSYTYIIPERLSLQVHETDMCLSDDSQTGGLCWWCLQKQLKPSISEWQRFNEGWNYSSARMHIKVSVDGDGGRKSGSAGCRGSQGNLCIHTAQISIMHQAASAVSNKVSDRSHFQNVFKEKNIQPWKKIKCFSTCTVWFLFHSSFYTNTSHSTKWEAD